MLLYKSIENKNNKENANITRALVLTKSQRLKTEAGIIERVCQREGPCNANCERQPPK